MNEDRIVVTGAAGRLGQRLVVRFRELGAVVAPVVRPGPAAHEAGTPYTADFLDETSVGSCFEAIARDLGKIDVLIHTVGAWGLTPISSTPLEGWEAMLRTNLVSTYLCFRAAATHMSDGGHLIAFTSAQGADRAAAEQSAYSAAKAGVIRLVESAAREFEDRGITAHAVAPSTILYAPEESGPGVRVEHVVDQCVRLCGPDAGTPSGSVVRAYAS